MMPEVRRRLAKSEAETATILTGLIPQEHGPEHLAACDILVSPHVPNPDRTPFFGSPTKLFEYMASEVPIVASDLPALTEILTHERNALLVQPDDPTALADGIRRLIDDPALAARLARNARLDVEKFTWNKRAERILASSS